MQRILFCLLIACILSAGSLYSQKLIDSVTSSFLKMKMPVGTTRQKSTDNIRMTTGLLDSFTILKDYSLNKYTAESFYIPNYDSLKARLDRNKFTIRRYGSTDFYAIKKDSFNYLAMISPQNEQTMVSMKPMSVTSSPQSFAEVNKIVASDRIHNAEFGQAVSISNNYAVVGVRLEDADAGGKNIMNDAGAVYIFERGADNKWKQVQKIVASDRAAGANFGWSVAISGNTIIVGAPYERTDPAGRNSMNSEGAVYIFERNADAAWNQTQKIVSSKRNGSNYFGYAVAIDNGTIVAGAIGHADDETDRLENRINDAGALFVFEKRGTNWRQIQKITANDHTIANLGDNLGCSVSISGDYIIGGAWGGDFDASNANRMEASGSAYIFEKGSDGKWKQAQKLVAGDRAPYDEFGSSVAISGDNAIVGAPRKTETTNPNSSYYTGNAYIFSRNEGGGWSQVQKINPEDRKGEDRLGWSVAINGTYAAISAMGSDFKQMSNEGAVYVYWQNPGGQWTQSQKLFSSDKGTYAGMGICVALSRNAIISGAITEHRDIAGKNEMSNAGAAYIFMKGATSGKPSAKPVTPKPAAKPPGNKN